MSQEAPDLARFPGQFWAKKTQALWGLGLNPPKEEGGGDNLACGEPDKTGYKVPRWNNYISLDCAMQEKFLMNCLAPQKNLGWK